ncbi:DUF1294 domain-containing protein [Carnobacterium sp.]|uniref:DUF1294 domain-containing protein n=1 Tax=Carnobacterium sp. TaxID=48221 RepID=UPI0028AFA14E|nr:DUF1294 domain-containing protein [Carnobacterium sp.]
MLYLFSYAVILNGWLFVLMGIDKKRAQNHQWRIPEKTLLLYGIFGGGLGGLLGMQVFHHKTSKLRFKLSYSLGTALVVGLFIYFS